jgi:hypothetical protein
VSKRRGKIDGAFSARLIEMLESPAYRALSLTGHRVLDRIEIEHFHHGGKENGRLPVTKQDFIKYGVHNDRVAPAIRECEALGFIRVKHGRGGNAEHRQPNKFFLTYVYARGNHGQPPPHDWRKIKTIEEAEANARAARVNKNERAVRFAQQRAQKTESRSPIPGPGSVPCSRTKNLLVPVPESGTTEAVQKRGPLSISRVGAPSPLAGARPHYTLPEQTPVHHGHDRYPCEPTRGPVMVADADERHTRKSLLECVLNVVDEQLHDLDPARVGARQRLQFQRTIYRDFVFDG